MPVMKFYAPYEAGFLPCEVMAYMLYPADEELRNAYLKQKMAEYTLFCSREDGLEFVPIEVLEDLLTSRSIASTDDMKSIAIQGSIAGEMLLTLIKLDASVKEASVEKAITYCQHYLHGAQAPSGKKIAHQKRTLRRAWSGFKPVAHLWAAFQIHVHSPPENLSMPINPNSYLLQLSLANELGKLAQKLSSKNAAKPIFSSNELWTLPSSVELPRCTFRSPGLDEQELEWLRRNHKSSSVSKYDN